MEEKKNKKNDAKKSNTVKKNSSAKKTAPKKVEAKKASSNTVVKKKDTKKVETKKIEPKKVAPKKVEPKVEPKKVEKEDLEKTIIFDGRQNKNLREVVDNLEKDSVTTDNKVIKRSKGKALAIGIIACLMVFIIGATTLYVINEKTKIDESNQTVNSNVYKKVNRKKKKKKKKNEITTTDVDEKVYEHLENITLKTFEEKALAKENMLVLVASNTCYHCATFEPILEEVLKERNGTILRLDIAKLTNTEVERFRTYFAFTVTPTIFFVKDGVVKAENSGSMSKEELTSWLDNNT